MKNLPERIYLNIGDEVPSDSDFRELSEVTWSEEKMFDNDIAFTRKPQWKSVEEELPEETRLVLAAFKLDGYRTARMAIYSHDYERWISFPGTCTLSNVDFWMPIPELSSLPDTNTEKK